MFTKKRKLLRERVGSGDVDDGGGEGGLGVRCTRQRVMPVMGGEGPRGIFSLPVPHSQVTVLPPVRFHTGLTLAPLGIFANSDWTENRVVHRSNSRCELLTY